MISSDEEDFDSLGVYISHSDEILAEAFERRVEEDSFGNSSIKYNGLKLKNKYREKLLELQQHMLIIITIYHETKDNIQKRALLKSLSGFLDTTVNIIPIAIGKSLEISISSKDASAPKSIANRVNVVIDSERSHEYINDIFILCHEIYNKTHPIHKGGSIDKISLDYILGKWGELFEEFNTIFPSESKLFLKLESMPTVSVSQVVESVEKSDRFSIIERYEYCLKNGFEITEHETLINIVKAYLENGKTIEARHILENLIDRHKTNKELWKQVYCLEMMGDISEREGDIPSAQSFYRDTLNVCEKFGKDLRYYSIENKYHRCQIYSKPTPIEDGMTIEWILDDRYERSFTKDGNFKLAKDILITKILLYSREGKLSKIEGAFREAEKIHNLSHELGTDLEYEAALILIENCNYLDEKKRAYQMGKSMLENCKRVYEKNGNLEKTMFVMISLDDFDDGQMNQYSEEIQKIKQLLGSIDSCISEEVLDEDLFDYLVKEKVWWGINRLFESGKFKILNILIEKYDTDYYILRDNTDKGVLEKFWFEIESFETRTRTRYSVRNEQDFDRIEKNLLYVKRWYRDIKKITQTKHEEELEFLLVRILECEFKFEQFRWRLFDDDVNRKDILIVNKIINLWSSQNSIRGEYRWKNKLARLTRREDFDKSKSMIEEIREFWKEIDSTKYFHLSLDYAYLFRKYQEVLDDSANIRNNDVLLYELYSSWAGMLTENNEMAEALEITKRAANILKIKKKLQLPTRLNREGYGYKSTFKKEISLLIKLKKYDEASIRIDEYKLEGYISDLKKLDFEFQILLDKEFFEDALENRRIYENSVKDLNNINLEDEKDVEDYKNSTEEGGVNPYYKVISWNLQQIISVYDKQGDKQRRQEWLLKKYIYDNDKGISDYYLGASAVQIGLWFKKNNHLDLAIEWYEKAIKHYDNCGKSNEYNYKQIAHSYNAKAGEIKKDDIEEYINLKKALEYFQKYDFSKLDEVESSSKPKGERSSLKIMLAKLSLQIASKQKKNDIKWWIEVAENFSKIDRRSKKIHHWRIEYKLWIQIAEMADENEEIIKPTLAYWKAHGLASRKFTEEYKIYDINKAIKCVKNILSIYSTSENLLTNDEKIVIQEIDNEIKKYTSVKEFVENILLILNQYLLIIHIIKNNKKILDDYEQLIDNYKKLTADNGFNLDEAFIEKVINIKNISDIFQDSEITEDLVN